MRRSATQASTVDRTNKTVTLSTSANPTTKSDRSRIRSPTKRSETTRTKTSQTVEPLRITKKSPKPQLKHVDSDIPPRRAPPATPSTDDRQKKSSRLEQRKESASSRREQVISPVRSSSQKEVVPVQSGSVAALRNRFMNAAEKAAAPVASHTSREYAPRKISDMAQNIEGQLQNLSLTKSRTSPQATRQTMGSSSQLSQSAAFSSFSSGQSSSSSLQANKPMSPKSKGGAPGVAQALTTKWTSASPRSQRGNISVPDRTPAASSHYVNVSAPHETMSPISSPSGGRKKPMYFAKWDWDAMTPGDLGFRAGELLEILDSSDTVGWWTARSLVTRKKGVVPSNYLKEYIHD